MVLGRRLARPDAPLDCDLHLPDTVAWAFHGRPRGTQDELEATLAPFGAQRFRVVRLLHAARIQAPRRGPGHRLRWGARTGGPAQTKR